MKLLIVDDDDITCRGFQKRIEAMHFPQISEVLAAFSAEDALNIVQTRRIHGLITDIQMSGKDGLELIADIRRYDKDLPCVVLTAYDKFEYARQALRLGVGDFLLKPCGVEEVRKTVLKFIEIWDARTEHSLEVPRELEEYVACLRTEALREAMERKLKSDPVWAAKALEKLRRALIVTARQRDCPIQMEEIDAYPDACAALDAFCEQMDVLRALTYGGRKTDLIAWAQKYTREHVDRNINMATVSNELNMNYSYFSKLFKNQTGKTFSEYMVEVKMREAGRMLMEGYRIGEIAEKLGYCSQQNFCRAFSRYWSVTPSQFRKR